MPRTVCHIDLDAFFAAVEEKHDPSLKGKPVLIAAGPEGRGAVACPNYAARKAGIKTGMPTREALKLLPSAIVVRANYERYQEASDQVLKIIYRFTPDIEPISLDECWFELTHRLHAWNSPLECAKAIQDAIQNELDLSASIGISTSKGISKIGSDFNKPHGITVVDPGSEREWLAPLSVKVISGVGRATYEKLSSIGIETIGDIVSKLSLEHTLYLFGHAHVTYLWEIANGRDDRPLEKKGEVKSISHQSTLQKNTRDMEYVESLLLYICERCIWRLKRRGLASGHISCYVRFGDHSDGSASRRLGAPSQTEHMFYPLITEMLEEILRGRNRPVVSFIGVALYDFTPVTPQEELFHDRVWKLGNLSTAMEKIRDRLGKRTIASARTFELHQKYRLAQAGLAFSAREIEETPISETVYEEAEF